MNFKYVTLLICVILLNLPPHQSESRETIRSLQKLAYDRQMLGAPHRKTGAYPSVREDSRSGVTTQLSSEVEFSMRSINLKSNYPLMMRMPI